MNIIRYYSLIDVNSMKFQKKIENVLKLDQITFVEIERCFNIEICGTLSLNEVEMLKWILSNPLKKTDCVKEQTSLTINRNSQLLIEIGTRLNFCTPFSSNAVSVCNSVGLTQIKRIEQSTIYLVHTDEQTEEQLDTLKNKIINILQDPMTECSYPNQIISFDHGIKPKSWHKVDVLNEGSKALEKIDEELGLSFDEWDIRFYNELFHKLKRNPTSVECFDLAQSNSEHSRHWFFKGILKIDGIPTSSSLFNMIMDTQRYSNQNNVIKFNDNSSAIQGFVIKKIQPAKINIPSRFETINTKMHLIFTAETHNFPTAISPFSGAATGTGGRIRDIQAIGRGGYTIAGTVGYAVGNLFIPGYKFSWEDENMENLTTFAKPLDILIEASNGCSDYGNKFGEPVICGFTRSYGAKNKQNQRIEYLKPILFSGGLGTVDEEFIIKETPRKGMRVLKIGGPVYRIGVGGGSASSTKVQGNNKLQLDFNAVQRGDAEMGQKLNRLVKTCIEASNYQNPILSIHDQGAGGNGNVLKELVEPEGAVIFTKAFELGDASISTLELWGAEYQENNAILCNSENVSLLTDISHRERCPLSVVGIVTGNKRIILTEEEISYEKFLKDDNPQNSSYPVDLDLELILRNMPKKEFNLTSTPIILQPLYLPENSHLLQLLHMVLRHPTVCSKRFLTNKVDRSVTGLIAQQQCVGPLHTPVADVAVTAISHFDTCGIATSIGEQPIKGLLNPAAGARMSVAEALSNLVFAKISCLEDVKCSGNWMWPAKLNGEGVHLHNACVAMCSFMQDLGIAIDGGKDSLSMATRLKNDEIIKSPGTLVISTYAPCPDITKVVTPDLKSARYGIKGCLLHVDVSYSKNRLGGTILSQCCGQLGQVVPDIDSPQTLKKAFNITQQLIVENKILSGHDISDGGLITCLIEMAISGISGIKICMTNQSLQYQFPIEVLFSEECGWIIECDEKDTNSIIKRFKDGGVICSLIGFVENCGMNAKIEISYKEEKVINLEVHELFSIWEETSYQIERLQANPICVEQEFRSIPKRKLPCYTYNFPLKRITPANNSIRVAVLREEGSNGDREMASALQMAGFEVWDVTMQDLLDEKITINIFRGIIFPGGFSYADVFGAAKGWAATILYHNKLYKQFNDFYRRNDTFSFGVCNGCQLMCLIRWIGDFNPKNNEKNYPDIVLKENLSGRFESRFSTVKIYKSPAIMLRNMENNTLGIWVAHGEGRFTYSSEEVIHYLEEHKCVTIRYVDENNEKTEIYPFNPNGSSGGVAGICSPDGRHLAMMPHPERSIKFWQWPYIPAEWEKKMNISNSNSFSPWFQIFLNAYKWCQDDFINDVEI